MSLLEPFYLLLAGAAAVPLLLHLMRRKIQARVDFPAVRYLARAEKENIRKIKMRNLLLMLLRIATVLILAFAAARPLGAFFGAGHVPTAMAVVLDNSLSTSAIVDGEPLLARLRALADEAASAATSSDRIWLVTADGSVVGGSRDAVREGIQRTDAFAGRGDLSAAVARAAGLVSGAGLSARQVVVVTDGQATTWSEPVSSGGVRFSLLSPPSEPALNRAVVEADARPSRWTPRGAVVTRATMPDSATYRIALGDLRLASGTVRGGEDITIHATPESRGWQSGVVELEPDELRGDDARYFAVWVGAAPQVRADPSAGQFVRTAIEAMAQNQRVAMGSDVVIAPADQVSALPALIIAPSDAVRLGAANRSLERLGVPWRFGQMRREETIVRGDRFAGTRVSLRYPLQAQAGAAADTIAVAGGDPWIVAGDGYVIIASPLDPGATDLPVSASFVPWLGDVIAQRLAGDATAIIETVPKGLVRLPGGAEGIEAPDGQVSPVASSSQVEAPARPGVYFVRRGEARIGALVVNAEPEESDLRRLPIESLRDRIRGRDVLVTSDVEAWKRSLFDAGSRRPLQVPLIVLALLLLAAETFLVRRSEGTTTAA